MVNILSPKLDHENKTRDESQLFKYIILHISHIL